MLMKFHVEITDTAVYNSVIINMNHKQTSQYFHESTSAYESNDETESDEDYNTYKPPPINIDPEIFTIIDVGDPISPSENTEKSVSHASAWKKTLVVSSNATIVTSKSFEWGESPKLSKRQRRREKREKRRLKNYVSLASATTKSSCVIANEPCDFVPICDISNLNGPKEAINLAARNVQQKYTSNRQPKHIANKINIKNRANRGKPVVETVRDIEKLDVVMQKVECFGNKLGWQNVLAQSKEITVNEIEAVNKESDDGVKLTEEPPVVEELNKIEDPRNCFCSRRRSSTEENFIREELEMNPENVEDEENNNICVIEAATGEAENLEKNKIKFERGVACEGVLMRLYDTKGFYRCHFARDDVIFKENCLNGCVTNLNEEICENLTNDSNYKSSTLREERFDEKPDISKMNGIRRTKNNKNCWREIKRVPSERTIKIIGCDKVKNVNPFPEKSRSEALLTEEDIENGTTETEAVPAATTATSHDEDPVISKKKNKKKKKKKPKSNAAGEGLLLSLYDDLNFYHHHFSYSESNFGNFMLFKENYLNGRVPNSKTKKKKRKRRQKETLFTNFSDDVLNQVYSLIGDFEIYLMIDFIEREKSYKTIFTKIRFFLSGLERIGLNQCKCIVSLCLVIFRTAAIYEIIPKPSKKRTKREPLLLVPFIGGFYNQVEIGISEILAEKKCELSIEALQHPFEILLYESLTTLFAVFLENIVKKMCLHVKPPLPQLTVRWKAAKNIFKNYEDMTHLGRITKIIRNNDGNYPDEINCCC